MHPDQPQFRNETIKKTTGARLVQPGLDITMSQDKHILHHDGHHFETEGASRISGKGKAGVVAEALRKAKG